MQEKRYVLGSHVFDNVDDYWNAQHDMKIIEIINRELDVHDPEVAIRLYNMIREGQIAFATAIGAEFTEHVTDVLADKSGALLDNKHTVDAAEKKVKKQRTLGIAVASLAFVLALAFGSTQLQDFLSARRLEQMAVRAREGEVNTLQRLEIAEANAAILKEAALKKKLTLLSLDFETEVVVDKTKLFVLPEFEALLAQNPDIKGWLTIPDTDVDYPVLQRVGDITNSYYLDKDINGKKDKNGSLFIDFRADIVNPTENTIIYGHNMNSGRMFGTLKNYLSEGYYYDHRKVKFKTLYEEREYEIVAVCLTEVLNVDDPDFRYYNFIDSSNEEEWNAFVRNVNDLSVYTKDVDLKLGDEVLTLSTCNSYTEDGRLFIVAKRII